MLWDPGDWAKGGWRTVGDSGPIPNWSLSLYTFTALLSCLLFPRRCSVALKLSSILLKGHFTQINEKRLTQLEWSLAMQMFLEQSESRVYLKPIYRTLFGCLVSVRSNSSFWGQNEISSVIIVSSKPGATIVAVYHHIKIFKIKDI